MKKREATATDVAIEGPVATDAIIGIVDETTATDVAIDCDIVCHCDTYKRLKKRKATATDVAIEKTVATDAIIWYC